MTAHIRERKDEAKKFLFHFLFFLFEKEMNENTFLIFTGIHPSLSLFQENIETEVMDS